MDANGVPRERGTPSNGRCRRAPGYCSSTSFRVEVNVALSSR